MCYVGWGVGVKPGEVEVDNGGSGGRGSNGGGGSDAG